ncbi:MAG: isoprenylcysteine carboxylmethyltransferase family protein [Syntrophobacterales bacterium]|jgi:protein-S-isoprenylcysteine O-methyltransferase Ste14|nr:isoprenylcysteine carboxylmethyltransferase family protein [Syntrophobacterales bacterium]
MSDDRSLAKRLAAAGGILFFFIMAFEVMIMISPFAFFFYSVFSPVFNFLGAHTATRWTTMFFLPHMILPPTVFLKSVRVAGSVLFLLGLATFTVCALQVYLGKIFKWGIADKGIYRYIRHPQYLALGLWGLGMAILWPRFIVLATLSLMFILYYFLAKDEERRMVGLYGDSYRAYQAATGMFLPRALEAPFTALGDRLFPSPAVKYLAIPVLIVILVMGSGAALREITLTSLPLAVRANLTLVPILPEDAGLEAQALTGILAGAADGQVPFLQADKAYLGYVMPADYIMQGMIADTGGRSHLFKQHHTVALISDWVFHPFAHLRRPAATHMAAMHGADPAVARRHHCPVGVNNAGQDCDTCTIRRVILVEVTPAKGASVTGENLLAGNVSRTPVGFIDLDTTDGRIIKAKPVARAHAWKDVPTPEI